jgi:tripartite-type tricarboxylate transporter receptor subunit TctC
MRSLGFLLFCLALTGACHAAGTGYPARSIRLVCTFPPGGSTDTIARILGAHLSARLGQQIIVDNRPGAGGMMGVEIAARATPDGYTWIIGTTSTHALAPALNPGLAYDVARDFAPVSLLGDAPYFLAAHPAVPAQNVRELIALARAEPGRLGYASAGHTSLANLAGLLFMSMARVELTHIPYKGSAPALVDLLAGRVQLQFGSIAPALPHVKTGRLRALGVTGARRVSVAPEIPTVAESGLPGYDVSLYIGVFSQAATPAAIVTAINGALTEALSRPAVREALIAQGLEPQASTPAQFGKLMERERRVWGEVIRRAGITGG